MLEDFTRHLCSDDLPSTNNKTTHGDVTRACGDSERFVVCAHLLQSLDYKTMLNVMTSDRFCSAILAHCLRLQPTPTTRDVIKAAQVVLLRKVNDVINQLPVPHQVTSFASPLNSKRSALQLQYQVKMASLFAQPHFLNECLQLGEALHELMTSRATLPNDSLSDVVKFAILCLEVRFLQSAIAEMWFYCGFLSCRLFSGHWRDALRLHRTMW